MDYILNDNVKDFEKENLKIINHYLEKETHYFNKLKNPEYLELVNEATKKVKDINYNYYKDDVKISNYSNTLIITYVNSLKTNNVKEIYFNSKTNKIEKLHYCNDNNNSVIIVNFNYLKTIHFHKKTYSHRDDGPAILDYKNKNIIFYKDGVISNKNNPAYLKVKEIKYFENGKLHAVGKPAVVHVVLVELNKYHYMKGKLHREDGPAIESNKIHKYYKDNKLHRLDGPAVICMDKNYESYYIDNVLYYKEHKQNKDLFKLTCLAENKLSNIECDCYEDNEFKISLLNGKIHNDKTFAVKSKITNSVYYYFAGKVLIKIKNDIDYRKFVKNKTMEFLK